MDWALFDSTIREDAIFLAIDIYSRTMSVLLLCVVISYWIKVWFGKRLCDANSCWGWVILLLFTLEGAFKILVFRDQPGWDGLTKILPWMQFLICGLWAFLLSQTWVAEGKNRRKLDNDDDDFKGPMKPVEV